LPRGSARSTLGRVRQLRWSAEVQTAQSQPSTGTPLDVPLPRNTSRREFPPAANGVAAHSSKPPALPEPTRTKLSANLDHSTTTRPIVRPEARQRDSKFTAAGASPCQVGAVRVQSLARNHMHEGFETNYVKG
jgi:hypothetical protein